VREGNERATSVHPTQAEAAKAGREIARKARSAFLLHAKDGRVRDRSDYGEDPVLRPKGEPPKGKPESPADEATLGRDAAADGWASGIVGGAIEGLGSTVQGITLGGETSAEGGDETDHRAPD
jgi:hypothetical protein